MKAPEYQSPDSVGKRPTLPIDENDPRLRWDKKGQTLARSGREVEQVNFVGGTGFAALQSQITVLQDESVNVQGSTAVDYGSVVVALGSYLGIYPNGSGPYIIVPTDPSPPTLTWVGDTLKIEFDFDVQNPINITVSQFIVQITAEGVTASSPMNAFPIDRSQNHQTLYLTPTINEQMFNLFEVNMDSLTVQAADLLGNISKKVAAATIPAYALDFSAPIIDSLNQSTGGYSFNITNLPTSSAYDAIDVWEIESNDLTQPAITYQSDNKTPSNYTRVYFQKINPVFVSTPNGNQRYVAVRFSSKARKYTDFTLLGKITPKGSANFDPTAPNPPTASASWTGGDLTVLYKLNSTKPGNRVGIQLVHTDSSNIAYTGTFYFIPDSTNITTNQTATIHAADMFAQFGAYYYNFQSASIFSTSLAGVQSSAATFIVPDRSNELVGITPTVTANPTANGYIVTWNQTAGTYADVYAKTTPWASYPTDESQRVYSGKSPVTIQSLDYTNTQYILIRLYNDYGQYSNYSALTPVVSAKPYNPGELSLISNPVAFQTNGSILAGNLTGTRVIFNKDGLFAYGSNGTPTTEIINTATGNTFMTSQAQIADWQITSNKIENTITPLGSSAQTYTGLSGTGSYAFWAGGTQTSATGPSSDSQAAFWVKPSGAVQATNISIKGGSLDIGGAVTVVKTITGTSGQSTITVSDTSGILTGMYLLANNIPANSTVQSIGSNTVTMSSAATGAVSGSGYFVSSVGAHITGSGLLVAQGATLSGSIVATSGLFSGDVGIGSSGALYSGTIVTSGTPAKGSGNIKNGYVLSSDGLTFYDNNAAYVTDINAATGALRTKSATIGSWNVNSSSIYTGNLSLNSSGTIQVTAQDTTTYKAGINAATTASSTVFYAGSGSTPGDSLNKFRVTMDGTIYGKGGVFTGGSVSSSGSLGTVTIDGVNDLISLTNGSGTSYIIPRNNNLYITAPSGSPFSSGSTIPSQGPTNAPYFAAGSSFKDPWNNSVAGIGIYTGQWDYFTYSSSNPFITATTTGLQLSGSPAVGIIIEPGGKTNSALSNASVLIYTSTNSSGKWDKGSTYGAYILAEPKMVTMYSNNTPSGSFPDGGIVINGNGSTSLHGTSQSNGVYIYAGSSGTQKAYAGFNSSGITFQSNTANIQQTISDTAITISAGGSVASGAKTYGQWTDGSIKLQADTSIYATLNTTNGIYLQGGSVPATTTPPTASWNTYIKINSSGITLLGNPNTTPTDRAYTGGSKIVLGTGVDSVGIFGFPVQGNNFSNGLSLTTVNENNVALGMGALARQRMLVEDPYDGMTRVGMAVYYQDSSLPAHGSTNILNSGASSGVVGDLWVTY